MDNDICNDPPTSDRKNSSETSSRVINFWRRLINNCLACFRTRATLPKRKGNMTRTPSMSSMTPLVEEANGSPGIVEDMASQTQRWRESRTLFQNEDILPTYAELSWDQTVSQCQSSGDFCCHLCTIWHEENLEKLMEEGNHGSTGQWYLFGCFSTS